MLLLLLLLHVPRPLEQTPTLLLAPLLLSPQEH